MDPDHRASVRPWSWVAVRAEITPESPQSWAAVGAEIVPPKAVGKQSAEELQSWANQGLGVHAGQGLGRGHADGPQRGGNLSRSSEYETSPTDLTQPSGSLSQAKGTVEGIGTGDLIKEVMMPLLETHFWQSDTGDDSKERLDPRKLAEYAFALERHDRLGSAGTSAAGRARSPGETKLKSAGRGRAGQPGRVSMNSFP